MLIPILRSSLLKSSIENVFFSQPLINGFFVPGKQGTNLRPLFIISSTFSFIFIFFSRFKKAKSCCLLFQLMFWDDLNF